MTRWQKMLLAGLLGGATGYGIDMALIGPQEKGEYAWALVPAALLSTTAVLVAYATSRLAPGEGFPKKV